MGFAVFPIIQDPGPKAARPSRSETVAAADRTMAFQVVLLYGWKAIGWDIIGGHCVGGFSMGMKNTRCL